MLAAAASVALVCYAGRHTWFRIDAWEFLLRSQEGSLDSWIRPHGSHLQLPAVALHRTLYAAFGMDFWPWYYLPHTLGYAGLVFYLWRALLARGADRVVAFVAYLVLLFLGAAAFLSSVVVGSLVVVALMVVIAARIDREDKPSIPQRLAVLAASLFMVTSSTLGIAALAGCVLAVTVSRRLRWWWWCFLPAALAYGGWYLAYGGDDPQGTIAWGRLLEVPGDAVRLLGVTWRDLTGLPGPAMLWGSVAALGLLLGLGWLLWRRRLRCWDGVFLFTVAAYALMVLMVRGGGGYAMSQARYGYTLIVLLVPLLVPHFRLPGRWPAGARIVAVALVGAALVGFNAWQRVEEINHIEKLARETRDGVEAVAAVVAGGEPAIDDIRLLSVLDIPGTAGLRVADVRLLVADGWVPGARPDRVGEMQVALRMRTVGQPPDDAPGRPLALTGVGEDGCVPITRGRKVTAEVTGTGWFTLERRPTEKRGRVYLTWSDGFGEFEVKVVFGGRRPVQLAAPVGPSLLTIRNNSLETVRACGLAEAAAG